MCFIIPTETLIDEKEDLFIITDRSKNKFVLSPVGNYNNIPINLLLFLFINMHLNVTDSRRIIR